MVERYPSYGNFADLPPERSAASSSQTIVVPVPFEGTSEVRGGVSQGPQAIVTASWQLEDYDAELGMETSFWGIHTLPPLSVPPGGPEAMVSSLKEVVQVYSDRLVVVLGGEHCITLGAVSALGQRYPGLSVLCLDAHADHRDEYLGTRFGHASVMRRVSELCPVTMVGLRSLCTEEADYLHKRGLRSFYAQDYAKHESAADVAAALGPDVYVSIDLDVLDPSLMPAVTHPVPGGLGWGVVLRLLRAVARERRVVGFDVVELAPQLGPPASAAVAAHLVYKFMGYILSRRISASSTALDQRLSGGLYPRIDTGA